MGSHSHHHANAEHIQGTISVCTVWDPISFTIKVKIIESIILNFFVNDIGSHTVHGYIVPCICFALAR